MAHSRIGEFRLLTMKKDRRYIPTTSKSGGLYHEVFLVLRSNSFPMGYKPSIPQSIGNEMPDQDTSISFKIFFGGIGENLSNHPKFKGVLREDELRNAEIQCVESFEKNHRKLFR